MKKIAILGVTGYIGRSLLREFFLEKKESYHLFLFSRSQDKLTTFIKEVPKKTKYTVSSFESFSEGDYDVIINCTGIGNTAILTKNPMAIFKVTEEVDTLVIDYLQHKPKALYINLSSGAVYGTNFEAPITEKTETTLPGGFLGGYECYAAAKINAEAKHRSLTTLNIVDIRIFAFFGSLVDVDSPFLMSEIAKRIATKTVFSTSKDDIVRDYITAKDLLLFVQAVMVIRKCNDFFDIYSKKPVSKFELLETLKKKYHLKYEIVSAKKPTKGSTKRFYFSKSKKANKVLGYSPTESSISGICSELEVFLRREN